MQLTSDLATMLSIVVKFIPQNFEAIGEPQVELCLVKFGKLDIPIRSLFANPVTFWWFGEITKIHQIKYLLNLLLLPNAYESMSLLKYKSVRQYKI